MSRRSATLVAVVVTALGVVSAAQAAPTVAITSPVEGAVVSRADQTMTVLGTAAFDAPLPDEQTYYLRGTGCGATAAFWLSLESGTDEYDGCGAIGGVPANELFHLAFGPAYDSFSAQNGVPVMLDASRNVTGTIRAESWFGDGIPGAGQVAVDLVLRGSDADGNFFPLGSTTLTANNTGADGVQLPFNFDIPETADRVVLSDLTLDVQVRGANYNSGNLCLSGDSKFTVPMYDAGLVEVSDASTFSAARTVAAVLVGDGTWEAEIPVPNVGNRKIYARAVQNGVTTFATPVSITVVS